MDYSQKLTDYQKEENGLELVETDFGFVMYAIKNKEFFISDCYVDKEHRGLGLGREVFEKACDIGREKGCHFVSANAFVNGDWEKFNDKVDIFQAVGLRIVDIFADGLTFRKNLVPEV